MKRKRVMILSVVLPVLVATALGIWAAYSKVETNLKSLADIAPAQIDLAAQEDGTYFGSYSVFPVSAKVIVTIENHKMVAIELIEHKHGQGALAETMPKKVLDAQTLQVDAVAGATYSSKVILKAIENALLGIRP